MTNGIIGKKVGMTQIFDKDGNSIPVTIVKAGPCKVLALLNDDQKVKLGYEEVKESRLNKAKLGEFKKLDLTPLKYSKEFFNSDEGTVEVGQEVKVDIFKRGDSVDVSGVSVGKGFQGGMKRWNWSGGPAAHGSRHHRRVGSIGASADPARTLKGTNMPGQMGAKNCTVQSLLIVDVDVENNLLIIKGAVPGHKNAVLTIRRALKKGFKDLDKVEELVKHKVNPMKQSKAKGKG